MNSLEKNLEVQNVKEEESLDKFPKEEVKWFECFICDLKEMYDNKTSKPSFTPNISFSEECYIVKDPFTAPEKKQFLILGSDCSICKKPVCQSTDCSIFYKQRYCQECAWKKKNLFPEQLRSKIKAQ